MLEKSFVPADHEHTLYDKWEKNGAFRAHPEQPGEPFSIMFPPPNVTGTLHLGHSLNFVLQDMLIRWKRQEGFNVLWQPGTDHAGIATQMVVERALDKEGSSRTALGRSGFLERVWEWKQEYGDTIVQQLRKLGASADWERERFTMDEGLSRAVRKVFVTLYNEGLIYRDRRLVNWDPKFRSAISDLEVENRETNGSMWYIRYPLEDGRTLTVATTRPETMLGDVAVAVHPEDERYTDMIGKNVILPLTGRRIPVVADLHSDPEKGTGAVKITPAHDFNDFEVGKRHGLPAPTVLDETACLWINEIQSELQDIAGLASVSFVQNLQGLSREEGRKQVVAELERLECLEKIEPHKLQVPYAERGGAIVEPRLTLQWYCDAKTLSGPAVEAVENGKIAFEPRQWENTFHAWMRDIQPWCISRQLWWGHRIPAWYGTDGKVYVAENEQEAQAQAGASIGLTQDEDVLDTWFSSALWPFTTLGWPDRTEELARYYPTSVLVTGFDIIFFWVARMMMMGLHFMDDVPFRTVLIHGLVRDEKGQKMSKSKGNGLDPLDLVAEFGADATRLAICAGTGPGRDIKLGRKRVEEHRAFVTKLWNAARFLEMNGAKPTVGFDPASVKSALGRWILTEANDAIAEAGRALSAYRFDEYANCCYRFVWSRFCDWFVEFSKPVFAAENEETTELRAISAHVLGLILRLMQPVIPFVTATLWEELGYPGAFEEIRWPQIMTVTEADEARAELDWVIRLIGDVRTVRSEMNIPPSQKAPLLLRDVTAENLRRARTWAEAIGRMARVSEVGVVGDETPRNAAQIVLDEATVFIPLEGLIDLDAERTRLGKEAARIEGEIVKVTRKLDNADFVARAKPEVVEENRERLVTFQSDLSRLKAALGRLA
ncbi:valine--tRNA ligase [Gluconobacter kanchanaburiensis]|uniref:Valine--tRNA ligase n=1 Tax=Gluconobacter kanchanaburiensis NBRC 103587 TaxID=1307948 RepID=A0A511B665_9PROT|nr:valine--tRNA ligase [Gluconobacter kanchanaburiensis]MBF0861240.1 valine--tRNA ligase [Gluconobacter kanchanaburiensis]GBR70924.1 valyl-tRNA synthetase [Gluconobacter kanchanaburiensis NBRC 103587]GEK95939.1 valine--tRNA ligase [Gluconobacter kanchanaburiensis NBRC 103587]